MKSDVCAIGMQLNLYMAGYTFDTVFTLEKGVPITTIKEMMGHEKIESTMNYANTKRYLIAADMAVLNKKLYYTES